MNAIKHSDFVFGNSSEALEFEKVIGPKISMWKAPLEREDQEGRDDLVPDESSD